MQEHSSELQNVLATYHIGLNFYTFCIVSLESPKEVPLYRLTIATGCKSLGGPLYG